MTSPRIVPIVGSLRLLALAYVGFVSLGLPDSILGAAWPSLRSDLSLPLDAAGPLLLLATAGAVLASTFSGRLLARISTAQVLMGSTLLAGSALAGFSLAQSWPVLLLAALLAGLGGGAVDAALNGFVARHYDVRHMNWLHGCWGVGATLGPLTLAASLAAGRSWRTAYVVLAAVELGLAALFVLTRRHWPTPAGDESARARAPKLTPAMRTSVAFFFVYGGLEAATGLWGASYLIATKGASAATASAVVAVYWGGLTAGRFLLGAVAARLGEARLVAGGVAVAVAGTVIIAVPATPLPLAAVALALLGVALAPLYPSLMHDTPRRYGAGAAVYLVGYQVAAASLGIALIPSLLGFVARRSSLAILPGCLLVLAMTLEVLRRRRG